MERHTVPLPDDHAQKLTVLFEKLGIPTERGIADPQIEGDSEYLKITPTFIWRIKELTDEQLDAFERAFNVRLVR